MSITSSQLDNSIKFSKGPRGPFYFVCFDLSALVVRRFGKIELFRFFAILSAFSAHLLIALFQSVFSSIYTLLN